MQKKVYLSVPLISNRDVELTRIIADIIKTAGFELTSYWVTDDDPGFSKSPDFVYNRDVNTLSNSDTIIAEVSNASVGVGMEIMFSKIYNKRIICLHQKDKPLSRMLKGMPEKILIEYETVMELKEKLSQSLIGIIDN